MIIAANTVITICAHISAGFHHVSTIIINAKIPLQWQDSPGVQAVAGFIATFLAVFFVAFFFAMFFSFYLVGLK